MTSIFASPTDRYRSAATAASDRPATNIRDGAGGIASCLNTLRGGVSLSCINDGSAKPINSTRMRLIYHAREVHSSVWILEQVVCPLQLLGIQAGLSRSVGVSCHAPSLTRAEGLAENAHCELEVGGARPQRGHRPDGGGV